MAACRPCTHRLRDGDVPLAAVAVREERRTKLGHAPLHRPPPPPLPPPPTAAGTAVSLRPSFPPSVMHQQQRQEASRYPLLGHHNTLCGLKPVVFHPRPPVSCTLPQRRQPDPSKRQSFDVGAVSYRGAKCWWRGVAGGGKVFIGCDAHRKKCNAGGSVERLLQ